MPDASAAPASNPVADVKPPAADSVLYFISNVDGDGALSYEIGNGSWINYWFGFPFELDGTRYYTGFAWETPEDFSDRKEPKYPAPGDTVTITQATFTANPPGSEKPWKFHDNQHSVGEFGGNGKGNTLDETRKPQSARTSEGNLLLAVPTWYLVSGTRMQNFELLLFNPHDLENTDNKRWTYVGSLYAGEDNSAACDTDAGGIKCVTRTGTLAFSSQSGDPMPTLRITTEGGPAAEIAEYRYDASRNTYQPTSR
ncbi:hypothetical protein [Pseudoxanthomonas sp. GM95]|uniref:hypothetical protein n=1 Tax=Pseudoxanthomonas sp. GM95 TaxID=1881043 RepID=UPI000B85BE01|nr:hypothetical protein [Pseudoxanthomonas sp. GM95]